jgi:hypothetical protein
MELLAIVCSAAGHKNCLNAENTQAGSALFFGLFIIV